MGTLQAGQGAAPRAARSARDALSIFVYTNSLAHFVYTNYNRDMTNTNLPVEIAQMLEQLGGRRIFAMAFTGCVYSVASDDDAQCPADRAAGLSLEIARPLRRTARGAAKVIVALEWDDTYTVKLWKAPTAAESARGEHEGHYLDEQRPVYADQLRAVVERMTGLVLSLGTLRAAVS